MLHIFEAKAQPWEWLPALVQTNVEPFGNVEILLRALLNLKALQR